MVSVSKSLLKTTCLGAEVLGLVRTYQAHAERRTIYMLPQTEACTVPTRVLSGAPPQLHKLMPELLSQTVTAVGDGILSLTAAVTATS